MTCAVSRNKKRVWDLDDGEGGHSLGIAPLTPVYSAYFGLNEESQAVARKGPGAGSVQLLAILWLPMSPGYVHICR